MSDEFDFDFDFDNEETDGDKPVVESVDIKIQNDIEPPAYIIKKLFEAKEMLFPWPHVVGKNIFPKSILDGFEEEIPDLKNFKKMDDNPKRSYMELAEYAQESNSKFWADLTALFSNKSLAELSCQAVSIIKEKKINPESLQVQTFIIHDEKGFNENPVIPSPGPLFVIDIYLSSHKNDRILYYFENTPLSKQFVRVDELSFDKNDFILIPRTEQTWFGTNKLEQDRWMIRYSVFSISVSSSSVYDFNDDTKDEDSNQFDFDNI